jgi:hypothetical protein
MDLPRIFIAISVVVLNVLETCLFYAKDTMDHPLSLPDPVGPFAAL